MKFRYKFRRKSDWAETIDFDSWHDLQIYLSEIFLKTKLIEGTLFVELIER